MHTALAWKGRFGISKIPFLDYDVPVLWLLQMKDAKEFYRPADIPASAWLSQQCNQYWPAAPLGASPLGRHPPPSSAASSPMMSPELRPATQPSLSPCSMPQPPCSHAGP